MTQPDNKPKKRVGDQEKRLLKPEDEALWRAVAKKVRPLSLKGGFAQMDAVPAPSPPPIRKQHHHIDPYQSNHLQVKTEKPGFRHGQAPGLDRKTQLRMRRGQVQVEGKLDLHGMIQTEAHHALLNFLEAAYNSSKRSVLIITGKGLTKSGEIGVLRQAVPRWLNESPMNAWIKGFDYAARNHGGEGALYVLIRRKR